MTTSPKFQREGQQLEVEPERQLDDARVAAEDLVRVQEVRRNRGDRVESCHARGGNRVHRVHGTCDVLRVVEGVEEVGAELNPSGLAELDVLEERDVEVVDARHPEGVTTDGGLSAIARLDVPRVRVVGEIADDIPAAVARRGDGASHALLPRRVQAGAVASAGAVQVGVVAAATRYALAGLCG